MSNDRSLEGQNPVVSLAYRLRGVISLYFYNVEFLSTVFGFAKVLMLISSGSLIISVDATTALPSFIRDDDGQTAACVIQVVKLEAFYEA